MTPDNMPSEEHEAFIRAAVALARSHGMDSLTLSFRTNFDQRMRGLYSGTINASWSEGRHGAKSKISVRFESQTGLDELEATT